MTVESVASRAQILANAKILLTSAANTPASNAPNTSSQITLVPVGTHNSDHEVVVFGTKDVFTAAVMVGLKPAIESEPATSPEAALRKLYLATCELLKLYIPKVGSHQRNIHGGGVFDDDMINPEIVEAQKKCP